MATIVQSRAGVQLNPDALMERAQKQAGLADFGDEWFIAPFHALIGFVNREASLPSQDVEPVRRLVGMLSDRLQLVDYVKRYPEVLDETVDVAGIIVAHARGGSTLTQRLMGRSPQLTGTYFYELMRPIPLRDERRGDHSARIALGDAQVREWVASMPAYETFHPMNSLYHEEDLVLGDRCFLSYMYSCQFDIPSYHEWMAEQDETRAYEEFKLFLKVLQHAQPKRRGKRWILKSVHHYVGHNLRTMFKTYPGVTAIMTHRPMDKVVPSLCDVQSTHIRQSQALMFNQKTMGERLIRQYLPAFADLTRVRAEMPDERWVDVKYSDLVSDPIGQFKRIMAGMGMQAGEDDIREASDWMAKNGRGTHPPHLYEPEDFGVTAKRLQEAFAPYHDRYLR